MTMSAKDAGAVTCRRAFGSLLTNQGRGYYVTLELLSIVWGTYTLNQQVLPADLSQLTYVRRSHDFARRWMANDAQYQALDGEFVDGEGAPEILRALLKSLRVPIPNRRSMPGWLGQHLYPYVGELIHYDAAPRHGRISLEQYAYRGAGGLAHKMLRSDPDRDRLDMNRVGLTALIEDSGGPLGQLAKACAAHDRAREVPGGYSDGREVQAVVDHTPWVDHLRNGVRNITARDVVRAKKVELLMLWVPYCIARHQLDRGSAILNRDPMNLPVSLVQRNSPVRQAARRELDHARGVVDEALRRQAEIQLDEAIGSPEAEHYERLKGARTWRQPMLGFFTQTLATVGALNAHSGSRYLTLQLPLLEAMVCASLEPGVEMRFDDYCREVLWGRYNLIVDGQADVPRGPTSRIDALDLAENGECLAQDLEGLGLLTAYSDATRMIHGEIH